MATSYDQYAELERFATKVNPDETATDLDLVCEDCGETICTVEAGDTLRVLASTVADHDCSEREWTVSGYYSMPVTARSEAEAIEKGCDKIGSGWHWTAEEVSGG